VGDAVALKSEHVEHDSSTTRARLEHASSTTRARLEHDRGMLADCR
jgi:hypothetical protein